MKNKLILTGIITAVLSMNAVFVKAQSSKSESIEAWVTTLDRSQLFTKQEEVIEFGNRPRGWGATTITIDDNLQMQAVDGFGFALTGGSAGLMMGMSQPERTKLINELFRTDEDNIGVSYIRLTIGASDLNSFVFSYNDLEDGEVDLKLEKFNLSQDMYDVIPVVKEILAVNPDIKILASPWSAPTWMKTNNKVKGGKLKEEYYPVYAQYFVKYINAMKEQGITIDAITVQNEPLNVNNTPSMQMLPNEQRIFIKDHLGPAFEQANIKTKIVLFDHNLDRIDHPLTTLSDPEAAKYADGSGFHHYGGELSALTTMHIAHPEKNLYFTEQMVVERPGSETIEIANQVARLIIGVTQNWSKNVILWNFAADPLNDPHTEDGGCSMCQGAVTIEGDNVSRNIAYYVVAHASKFVRPGSVRIGSTQKGDTMVNLTQDEEHRGENALRVGLSITYNVFPNVAFRTPSGKTVLIVANDSRSARSFRIKYNGQYANVNLSPGAVGTYVW
ncbi:glucosylceramidase [Draconibacterium orientale]|uniref:Glucosylceramidase n=1 Tax=Draconibacterium orientale TaxID=1168034 RepID=X5DJ99_9BACT|nr:glycoside hydrolase family 30 beta sandwich domain-containing protein [Draconibacterium orientale]AHW60617.1 glucosylceramidase [Draconibacterium orientale]SET05440.1 glucosylceramidase [Draconibacterium orientale]